MCKDLMKKNSGFGLRRAPGRINYLAYSVRSAQGGELRRAYVNVRRAAGDRQHDPGQRQRGGLHVSRRSTQGRVIDPNDCLLRRQEVEARCGIARSTIYRLMSEDRFPQPLRIGARAVRWSESEIVGWLASLPRATGQRA